MMKKKIKILLIFVIMWIASFLGMTIINIMTNTNENLPAKIILSTICAVASIVLRDKDE